MSILVTCILGSLLTAAVFAPPKQENAKYSEDILQRKVWGNEIEFLKTRDAFYFSLSRTRLPGGIVRVDDCEEDTLMQSWKPLDSPLGQVLDTLIATDPKYKWEIQDGVVNLLPAAGEPVLLRTRVEEFDVEDMASPRESLNRLMALPEVKMSMHNLHLKQGIAIVTGFSPQSPRKSFVKQRGGTLRQALNAIAHAQGRAFWDYIETHCGGNDTVIIRF